MPCITINSSEIEIADLHSILNEKGARNCQLAPCVYWPQ